MDGIKFVFRDIEFLNSYSIIIFIFIFIIVT